MSFRVGGAAPQIVRSNEAYGGAVQGSDIGDVLPGVLESLQESSAATITPRLYYDEVLGKFNYPSYQRTYGIHNSYFQNIQRFGETGEVWVDRDIFWNGPAAINLRVQIPSRFMGTLLNFAGRKDFCHVRPQIFYGWGAGYAAVKQIEYNLGGAMTYRMDRYSNFIAIMSSCYTVSQRYGLMKCAGGGVTKHAIGLESLMGLSGNTAEYAFVDNFNTIGATDPATVWGVKEYMPVYDNWFVALKTPHTNFNNPRNPRKSVDTNLVSEPFSIRIITSALEDFTDSGVGICPLPVIPPIVTPTPFYYVPLHGAYMSYLDIFRQYGSEVYAPLYDPPPNALAFFGDAPGADTNWSLLENSSFSPVPVNMADLFPTSTDLVAVGNPNPYPLRSTDDITLRIEHIVSSLRLTNPMLGAYDVLKGRTDQAIYYPFQHFTTQAYYPSNPLHYGVTMQDIINGSWLESTIPERQRTMVRQTINIPVNPLTAMYIMVFREKDRSGQLSKPGGYSPALFWEGLYLPRYALSYGSERLVQKDSYGEILSDQLYNACSSLFIPYKGGCTTRSEAIMSQMFTTNSIPIPAISVNSTQGLYSGVDRVSYLYEINLCEHRAIMSEETFQQTPSFLGEQLNFDFYYEPLLCQNMGAPCNYDPAANFSLLDVYPPTAAGGATLANTYSANYNDIRDDGIPASEKGYGKTANPWVINNGPLLIQVVYAQNALWQLNPNFSKVVFARG